MHLRLKREISRGTPFGGEQPNETSQSICTRLLEATTETAIRDALDGRESPSLPVDIDPWATRCTFDEIISEQLDFLHHEAFYVVDSDLTVTAYRTHWFGLQYDCAAVETAPTVGNGFAQGEFRALKAVTDESCTCPDWHQCSPEGGCKRLRRVGHEIKQAGFPDQTASSQRPRGRAPSSSSESLSCTG
ncbi:hypothetical protein I7X12_12615 [Halosimplex litoreum]|uniref:Uncharacterized protein n=1 Tax=Halosimplex litoreum TaxID=1198301 RepID=A0A7U3WTC0_9EURY|nr:DUF6735 family protein [Halosimplex litoreum]QPV65184.1 hypothetical protein I7X12_12615 [Halosimplex litoreum]